MEIGSNSIGPGMRVLQTGRTLRHAGAYGRTGQGPRASAIFGQRRTAWTHGQRTPPQSTARSTAALADKRIVGGVVLVMQDGEIAYRRAAGLADRERAASDARGCGVPPRLADQAAGHRGGAAHGRAGQDRARRSGHALSAGFPPRAAERRGAGDHAAPSAHPHRRPRLSLHAAGRAAPTSAPVCRTAPTSRAFRWRRT